MARKFVLKSDTPAVKLTVDYASQLNPQQLDVVSASGGSFLVIAGAGTGKTRTLIYRVSWLIEHGTPAEKIVLLTFTRRSAREMLRRANDLLGGRAAGVRGGTFHSFCLSILRKYASYIGFPSNFTILDDSDATDVVDLIRTAKGLNKSDKRFPRKKTIKRMFSACLNRDFSLQELLTEEYPQYINHFEDLQKIRVEFYAYKKKHGLVDYDDLQGLTLQLLLTHDKVRKSVAAGVKHLLVDEYQDTNRVQAALIRLLTSIHQNLMVVGDDAQSIYRFRGADFKNILNFPNEFDNVTTLKIEENYRSVQPILDLANHVMAGATFKHEKKLFTKKEGGELPAIIAAPDDRFQSRFVTQMILSLREDDIPLNDMAVLFRSGHDSYDLELELSRQNIPFVKFGGQKMTEAAHIKDVLAYLRILENAKDAVAWHRILKLIKGIGAQTSQRLTEQAVSAAESDSETPYLLGTGAESLSANTKASKYQAELQQLSGMLMMLQQSKLPLQEQLEIIIEYYQPILKEKYPDDADKRLQDLEHFIEVTREHTSRGELLSMLTLDPISFSAMETKEADNDEPPLVLSTIHSAKGLEFHSVFIIQMLDGILPSGYSIKEAEALDEERRLLYVAITRAEENLFISYPLVQYRRTFGDYLTNPSRFIEDINETLLEPMQLVESTGAEDENPPALPE